ncbi:MAG: hypothetical protein RR708_01495 [Bacilli bacterium]
MNEIKEAYEAIQANQNLNDSLKENFEELITIFHSVFEKIDLNNFNERIKGLKIKRGSRYLINTDTEYNPRENILYINEEKLKESDATHSLMMNVLQMVTSKENFYGLNDNLKLSSVDIGITEMIANNLVGNEEEIKNQDELIMANLYGEVVGINNMMSAYFQNDSSMFIKPLMTESYDMKKTQDLLDMAEYNYKTRDDLKTSNIDKMQSIYISLYINKDRFDYITNNVITNPAILNDRVQELNETKLAINNYSFEEKNKIVA